MLTHERLKQLLSYDPETGFFVWQVKSKGRNPGDIVGRTYAKGYMMIGLEGKTEYAHRLAYFYMTGAMPEHEIDHINGVKNDNRWSNLRMVTKAENQQNVAYRNPTGYQGVQRIGQTFRSIISVKGKQRHLGTFQTAEEAHNAYLEAKREHHPFAVHHRL